MFLKGQQKMSIKAEIDGEKRKISNSDTKQPQRDRRPLNRDTK